MKENWTYKKLGEVCTIERGGSPRPINEYITDDSNGLNWIKIGDAKEGSKFITSTKEKIKPEGLKKTRLVHKGDFILSNSMSFGKPYILDIDGCIHDGWLVIHDDNGTFDKSYLYYLLGSPNMYKEFQRLAVGGVVNNLNSEIVRNVVVPIPPIETQSRSVSELDLLQSIIDKQKTQLKELDNLAQAVFYDMFGDPVENDKGWEVKKLGEVTNKISDGVHAKPNYTEAGMPFISVVNINRGKLNFDDCKYVSISDGESFNKRAKPEKGDVLYTKVGATYGIPAIVDVDIDFCLYVSVCLIKPNKELINSSFLTNMMRLPYIKHQADERIRGIGVPDLHLNQISAFDIILPPLSLQQSFASKIESIEKQKAAINQSIAETQRLFDYTMDKYFG